MRSLYPLNQIPNFFIWWYAVKGRDLIYKAAETIAKIVGMLNLIPMMVNFHRPLFADVTISGRIFSLILRTVWIIFGLLVFLPAIAIILSLVAIWFMIPPFLLMKIFF